MSTPPAALPPSSDTVYWSRFRRPPRPSDLTLLPESQRWLVGLPAAVVPRELAAVFPRIVNEFVARLPCPRDLADYMDSLLVDRRGNRSGFPPAVLRELLKMHEYFERAGAYGTRGFRLAEGTPGALAIGYGAQRARHAELELATTRRLPAPRRARPQPVGFKQRALRLLFSPVLQFQR